MDGVDVEAAERLLGCPRGARRTQVQSAYRRTLLRGRPDLGHADAVWTFRVQAARDVLLAWAPVERRHDPRREAGPEHVWRPRRRVTWGLTAPGDPAVDVRL